jgi:hypothetical protein
MTTDTGSGTGTAVSSDAHRYATVAELKAWLGITDATDDTLLAYCLDEACSDIDGHLGRFFYQTDAGTVRYYTATRSDILYIDDCVSLTAVETDDDGDRTYETTWTATDYDLEPYNAADGDQPYTTLAVTPEGDYTFPAGVRKGVKLTGTWGWPKVPDAIARAAVLRAAWIFKRKDSPLGMSGNSDLGVVRVGRYDSDFEKLTELYRKLVVA